jgi:hypothetical protein
MADDASFLTLTLRVLWSDAETLFFGALAAVLGLGPPAWLGYSILQAELHPSWPVLRGDAFLRSSPWVFTFTLIFYWIALGSLMNVGIIACAAKRLRGGEPTIADGFAAILRGLPSILGLSLVTAGVMTVISRAAEGRSRAVRAEAAAAGSLIVGAHELVLPIIVIEGLSPFAAIKRAAALAKENFSRFGATLAYGISSDFVMMIPMAWPAVVFVMLACFPKTFEPILSNAYFVVAFLYVPQLLGVMVLGILVGTLNTIYSTAVYLYVSQPEDVRKEVVKHFPEKWLAEPFRPAASAPAA